MREKHIIYTAKILSMLFAPFYLPVLAFLLLFMFSYMKLFPLNYTLMILMIVYCFTVMFPLLGIYGWRKLRGLHRHQLTRREMRTVPYFIFIFSYFCCLYIMRTIHTPHFATSVLVTALILQIICAIINNWFRISAHSAAAGSMVGALLAFSIIFSFNPIWWLCLTLFIAGCVGTSRLILRQHRLNEVNYGLLVGLLCGFFAILLV